MSICGSAEGANTSICIAIHLMLRKVHQCCRHRDLFGITSSQRTDGVLTSSFWLHLLRFHDFLRLLITHLSSSTYATAPKFRKVWRNVVRYIDWIVCAALSSTFISCFGFQFSRVFPSFSSSHFSRKTTALACFSLNLACLFFASSLSFFIFELKAGRNYFKKCVTDRMCHNSMFVHRVSNGTVYPRPCLMASLQSILFSPLCNFIICIEMNDYCKRLLLLV